MDKAEWKSFLRWLDSASAEELRQKKVRIAALCRDIDDRDVKADARRMVRLIDQDLLARESLAKRPTGRRWKRASAGERGNQRLEGPERLPTAPPSRAALARLR